MFQELNSVIGKRVKEVLQFHLNGTSEEFDAAATAVMAEFTAMGDSLSAIVFEAGGVQTLADPEGREELATQLTDVLSDR
jgi:hypothetical protein|tara:strand:- start:172 stop:411 length:240 start_codon:yes stop_codon:yes gene_type:complete